MTPTKWKPPRTGDAPLKVKFRDGTTSKTALPAAKWNWANREFAFDIIAFWKEEN
ncbi:hypothetical protein ACTJI5_09500 [Sphingopyxis sp. 22461]